MTVHKLELIQGGSETDVEQSDSIYFDVHGNRIIPSEKIENLNFDAIVSQYYLKKSMESDSSDSVLLYNQGCTSEELAQKCLAIPASEPRHVLVKLNILENEFAIDMDLAAPVERKHLLMLAALKADMITLLAKLA
jgi:hypothetical protein